MFGSSIAAKPPCIERDPVEDMNREVLEDDPPRRTSDPVRDWKGL
jgi:hypothetical protein